LSVRTTPEKAQRCGNCKTGSRNLSHKKVVTGATLRKVGDGASLGAYLEKHAQKTGDFANISYVGMGFQIHNSHFHGLTTQPIDTLSRHFLVF
jgi:hypothetical protein